MFPARAGVIPGVLTITVFLSHVPRASGGDPEVIDAAQHTDTCSPRERG